MEVVNIITSLTQVFNIMSGEGEEKNLRNSKIIICNKSCVERYDGRVKKREKRAMNFFFNNLTEKVLLTYVLLYSS